MATHRCTLGRVVLAAAALAVAPVVADPVSAAAQAPTAAPAGQQPPPGTPQRGGEGRGEGRGEGGGRGQGRGGGGPRGAAPLNFEDRAGFEQIFDGVSMKNWDGDPTFWKVENGALVGTSTEANAVKENTFVIWRGGEPADFELKLEYRMSSTNSGIQFRSTHLPSGSKAGDETVTGKWVLKGYQADIDFDNRYTGMIYEERGREFLMQRGQAVQIGPDASSRQIGNLQRNADELKALIKAGEWNTVHLIARGTTIMNIVNGHVTAFIVDDDAKGRALKGLLGFQIHTGPPMKIEFRNIYLKTVK
jgi:hypothetical protein